MAGTAAVLIVSTLATGASVYSAQQQASAAKKARRQADDDRRRLEDDERKRQAKVDADAARDQARLARRTPAGPAGGTRSTILTSPLGIQNEPQAPRKTLLGL